MDDPESTSHDPRMSRDENADTYRDLRTNLLRMGYQSSLWTHAQIAELIDSRARRLPFVEEFVKRTPRATLVIRAFFGPTGINEDSRAFHYFFKDAIENASVMIYDGHSGLGGHLDLPSIEDENGFRVRPNPNRYQIYFFNSCSSYSYYNSMFFGRKRSTRDPRGTRNLDILTNGLATYFNVTHDTNVALISAIDAWANGKARVSYQEFARQIDSDNLFGVNGDEDNPKN